MRREKLSKSNEYKTPAELFRPLHRRYRYTVDIAAAKWNHQLPKYFTRQDDAFLHHWGPRGWLNSPYTRGHLPRWGPRARQEVLEGYAELISMLCPHSTSDAWWHEVVEAPAGRWLRALPPRYSELGVERTTVWSELAVRVLTLKGRLGFEHESGETESGARHHSVVVTFIHPRSRHARS